MKNAFDDNLPIIAFEFSKAARTQSTLVPRVE